MSSRHKKKKKRTYPERKSPYKSMGERPGQWKAGKGYAYDAFGRKIKV